jgi:hypothetical protein
MTSRESIATNKSKLNKHRLTNTSILEMGVPATETLKTAASSLPPVYKINCLFALTLYILISECVLNFVVFAYTGLALKWDLTFGDEAPHHHPHIPEESYIQRPNNLLSIIMVATIFNFVESIVLLSIYCRNKGRGMKPPRFSLVYRTIRIIAVFFSWLCIILSGMALAACWALQQELYPPDLRYIGCQVPSGCTLVVQCSPGVPPFTLPPPPPPPVTPVLPSGELYLLYAFCGVLSLLKFFSYSLGIPILILQWPLYNMYN